MQQKMQQARRENKDRQKLQAALADASREARTAIQAVFKPEQWERLDQIQLQAQGPLAFARPENGPWAAMAYTGPPLAERLKLSDDQLKRIRTIAQQADQEIQKAASFPIALDAKTKPPSKEEIHKLRRQPGIQGGQAEGPPGGQGRRAAVIRRIEDVLTEPQREAYHKLIGAPFDFSRLTWGPRRAAGADADVQTGGPGLRRRRRPARRPRLQHQGRPAGLRRRPDGTRASSSTRPTTTSTPPAAATSRSPS